MEKTETGKRTRRSGVLFYYLAIAAVFAIGMLAGWALAGNRHAAGGKPAALPDTGTCEKIEELKSKGLVDENTAAVEDFIKNAEIYSDLVKYGCPENSARFRQLAVRHLDIAAALRGEDLYEYELNEDGWLYKTRLRVYKNLDQESEAVREARRVIEKAHKFGEPALRFIAEIEKIISE